MPVSAARWMAWMVARSNVADSRRPWAAGSSHKGSSGRVGVTAAAASVGAAVVDLEVVEVAGGAVAAEGGRVLVDPGGIEQFGEFGDMFVAQRLLDAVPPDGPHPAPDADTGLVEG